MIVLLQLPFYTTWASLIEMDLKLNSLDWNGNELEHEHELDDMKRTDVLSGKNKPWRACKIETAGTLKEGNGNKNGKEYCFVCPHHSVRM